MPTQIKKPLAFQRGQVAVEYIIITVIVMSALYLARYGMGGYTGEGSVKDILLTVLRQLNFDYIRGLSYASTFL